MLEFGSFNESSRAQIIVSFYENTSQSILRSVFVNLRRDGKIRPDGYPIRSDLIGSTRIRFFWIWIRIWILFLDPKKFGFGSYMFRTETWPETRFKPDPNVKPGKNPIQILYMCVCYMLNVKYIYELL